MGIKHADSKRKKALKILLFGDSGTGKTHFALQASPGKTLIFDAEGGTDLFEGRKGFNFDYWTDDDGLKTSSVRELNKAIDFLETDEGRKTYDTFIIDPISDIYDNLQAQRIEYKEERAREKAEKFGREYVEKNEAELDSFNMKDWGDIKRIYKNFMLRLKNLPQNIILIAREKEISETKPNGDVVKTGEYTYEAEKNTKYAVDFAVRLIFDEKKQKRTAVITKTRSDGIEKGEVFENPTFAMFDEVVNSMANGKDADKISTKNENVFNDEENKRVKEDDPLVKAKTLIGELAKELTDAGIERKLVSDAIKKHNIINEKATENYNKITDIKIARKIYKELESLRPSDDDESEE
jgi:hypothetical protein